MFLCVAFKLMNEPSTETHPLPFAMMPFSQSIRRCIPLLVLVLAGMCIVILTTNVYLMNPRVPCLNNNDQTKATLSEKPTCNVNVFREYFRSNRRFPMEGRWNKDITSFQPDLCVFNHSDPAVCFAEKKIKHVVLFGDSNGSRYFDGFVDFLNSWKMGCRKERGEHFNDKLPETEYFAKGDKYLESIMVTHRRGCRTCGSAVMACNGHNGHHLLLEYIALYSLNDSSISLNSSLTGPNSPKDHQFPHATTFGEYIFKVYFKESCPDIVLLFVPFNHDVMNGNVTVIRQLLKDFMSLLEATCQTKSVVYWLTTPSENIQNKPEWFRDKLYEGMTTNEKIIMLNYLLYNFLEPQLLDPSSNTYGFFNHFELSRPKPDLNIDGVHLVQSWYVFIASALTYTFCGTG